MVQGGTVLQASSKDSPSSRDIKDNPLHSLATTHREQRMEDEMGESGIGHRQLQNSRTAH